MLLAESMINREYD